MEDILSIEKSEKLNTARVEDFLIHTMPKRFINVKNQEAGSHRGTGVLILGIGGIILVLGLFFVYFYVIKPSTSQEKPNIIINAPESKSNNTQANIENQAINAASSSSVAPAVQAVIAPPASTTVPEEPVAVASRATSSAAEPIIASGSEEIATTTAKIEAKNIDAAVKAPVSDADADGLSDVEEAVLGTDKDKADSDGDGYGDLAELLSLHNPAGMGNVIENQKIKKYFNRQNGYSLYYPSAWTVSDSGDSVIFKINDLQYIQVIVSDNTKAQNLENWYKEQSQTSEILSSQQFEKRGWKGIKSQDGLIVYLSNPMSNSIFTVNYNPGEDKSPLYQNIFKLMVSSLELGQ